MILIRIKKNLKKLVKTFIFKVGLGQSIVYFRIKHKIQSAAKLKKPLDYSNRKLFFDYNNKVVFLHIPKAAGMSIVKALYNIDKSHHATALDYFNEDPDRFKNAFTFTIVRNPYERLYSAYIYLKRGGMNPGDKVWRDLYISKYNSFEDFVLNGGLQNAVDCYAEHFIPQFKFIYDGESRICDYIGYLEKIQDVEFFLSEAIGKKIVFSRKNVTSTQRINLSEIYSKKMYGVVNEIYKKDFKLLGYELNR
ncbi:sulfotransferase family protein [Shewanella abyssi]|uniref:sulfotransferase family 2 domain-containing protein n=1 Tax=Shewanella abyssi TaxID=311789 RepID=UPI00200E4400|nr:sulfotransferase family 2 domain-containing protein [Shewanella abyssi]MCL1049566.1 sulfotransferase family protein [Shewanella abyssi]